MHLFLLIASFIIMPTFCMKNTVLSQQVTAFYDKKITSKEKFKIFLELLKKNSFDSRDAMLSLVDYYDSNLDGQPNYQFLLERDDYENTLAHLILQKIPLIANEKIIANYLLLLEKIVSFEPELVVIKNKAGSFPLHYCNEKLFTKEAWVHVKNLYAKLQEQGLYNCVIEKEENLITRTKTSSSFSINPQELKKETLASPKKTGSFKEALLYFISKKGKRDETNSYNSSDHNALTAHACANWLHG